MPSVPSILVCVAIAGCAKAPADGTRAAESKPAATTSLPTATPAAAIPDLAWHTVDPASPLGDSLAAFAKQAKGAGKKAYAYLHAEWCGPCQALEKTHAADASMVDAFSGTAIALIDIDAAGRKTLDPLGLDSSAIPVFYRLDDNGKPTGDKIDGGAWGDNIPANMAPPLKAFFSR